jgi:hypothetical protein
VKKLVLIHIILCLAIVVYGQKQRLEGDDSPFLCKVDSVAETFMDKLHQARIDSTISILYDYDNGRLQNSRRAIFWTNNGESHIRLVEGCNEITKDTTFLFNSSDLWTFIDKSNFEDVTVAIKSKKYVSHDKFYHITVTAPHRNFFVVLRDYERKDNSNEVQSDTRVVLANMIDKLLN